MSVAETFFDTSVLMYLLSQEPKKAERAEELLEAGGVISVQVLNEMANAATRRNRLPWPAVRETLEIVRTLTHVEALTLDMHERALDIAERYQFSFYDSLIVAAALESHCSILYCEDLQNGQRIERSLRVVNPFAP